MNLLAPLRRLARRALNGIDRLLHPSRRRAALARLRAAPPKSLLFVCHGNICRSPFAAVTAASQMKARGVTGVGIASGGVIGPDRPSPDDAIAAAAARGIDLAAHRSQLLTPAIVGAADLVIVMDTRQRHHLGAAYGRNHRDVLLLGDLDPVEGGTRTIADPVEKPREVFDACYVRIDRCVAELVAALAPPR